MNGFEFAIAYVGTPPSGSVPTRAELISLFEVRRRFPGVAPVPLAEPIVFDARVKFTHFVGDARGGFLLAS